MTNDNEIARVEEALLALLKETFPAAQVEGFPDNLQDFTLRRDAAVLTSYDGREFSDPESGDPFVVVRIRFTLTIIARNARRVGAHRAAFEMLSAAAEALTRRQIEGFTFYPGSDAFIGESDGEWSYGLDMTGYRTPRLILRR